MAASLDRKCQLSLGQMQLWMMVTAHFVLDSQEKQVLLYTEYNSYAVQPL